MPDYFRTVAKVIIAQDSLGAFLNNIRPGSYRSPTQVNFHELDIECVQPLGIYGSKEEIVKFLQKLGVVEDAVYALFLDVISVGRGLPLLSLSAPTSCSTKTVIPTTLRFALDCTLFAQLNGTQKTAYTISTSSIGRKERPGTTMPLMP